MFAFGHTRGIKRDGFVTDAGIAESYLTCLDFERDKRALLVRRALIDGGFELTICRNLRAAADVDDGEIDYFC